MGEMETYQEIRRKQDAEIMRSGRGIPLRVDGLVKGAKLAIDQGLSFKEYCEMLEKVVIPHQPVGLLMMKLECMHIHHLWGVCPECGKDYSKLDEDEKYGFCLECGWDNLPVLEERS